MLKIQTHLFFFIRNAIRSKALLPADVGLLEIRPHADGLSVELIGLLQPRLVGSDQIGQVYVNVEVVGGYACGVLLPRNDLGREIKKWKREVFHSVYFTRV